jgi:hypothetical protein
MRVSAREQVLDIAAAEASGLPGGAGRPSARGIDYSADAIALCEEARATYPEEIGAGCTSSA